ncbi:MAG TPA: SulP family inorganic anion transporter [Rhizomicrobium sp.]|jgi:MFS superfamily sulfate permease-like transporter
MGQPLFTASANLPVFRALAGWRCRDLGPDLAAGLTLAAIAIPEQMATAQLGGFAPSAGFVVFIAGTIGFALFGSSRMLSSGADSTITPIFAGTLALFAANGSPVYFMIAALLALMTGVLMIAAGLFRMGWIANLLSIPVMTGFLAGIAIHIAVSQLPELLGLPRASGNTVQQIASLAAHLGQTNLRTLALGAGVFAVTLIAEKIDARIPGALVALAAGTLLAAVLGWEQRGVAVIGPVAALRPHFAMPDTDIANLVRLLPLALIVAMVAMVQTAATTRGFAGDAPDINGDFIGIGVGNVLSGLVGGFAVNASPPRTGAVAAVGGRSQVAGLLAVAAVAALLLFGTRLLRHIPTAALAGILLFVAQRITNVSLFMKLWTQSRGEILLVLATVAAIAIMPIQLGVSIGILLSLLNGLWSITRARPIEFERIPGTTVWWAENPEQAGDKCDGVLVLAFQAPLAFVNAAVFERDVRAAIDARAGLKLVVLEASSIVTIDFTAAQSLANLIRHCRANGIAFAVARLESTRAERAFAQFGLQTLLADGHLFHSVQDAIETLMPRE